MLLALTNFLDSNWDTVWLTLAGLFGVQLLLSLILALRKRSLRFGVWGAVSGLVICSFLAVIWHYFGWDTEHTDTGWAIRRHRTLGRVTQLAYDTNGNWFADAKYLYRFSDPWVPERQYEPYYVVGMEDRNHDGRWDTWFRPTGKVVADKAVFLLEADTDLDGKVDSRRETAAVSDFLIEVQEQRGF